MPYWTAEQDARLTELWADKNISSSQIAREMGFIDRNAVIGRAYRLGLESRKPSGRNTVKNKAQTAEQTAMLRRINSGKPRGQPPPIKNLNHSFDNLSVRSAKSIAPIALPRLDVADTDIPAAQRRDIFSLTNETCRWPIGDPATPSFFFCGHASADVDGGEPYCTTHAKRAFSGQGG